MELDSNKRRLCTNSTIYVAQPSFLLHPVLQCHFNNYLNFELYISSV